MLVVINTGNPHVLVPVPMMIAVVVAFARCNYASGGQHGETHKEAADYDTFCVFHVRS
jgi:hypothetical protein